MIRFLAVPALVVLLGGCDKSAPGQSEAPVPVLTGTISDAMIPFDRLTSQPPLDPRADRSAGDGPGKDADAEATGAPDAAPSPVPAATTPAMTGAAAGQSGGGAQ